MWISENYCKNWNLKEGIREFLLNQYDGIIEKIKSKNNLIIKKIGKIKMINGRPQHLNFDFFGKDNKIYGEIRYDKTEKSLSISNEGKLLLGDFLLGSLKEKKKNSDLIGKFGEGMKLAILALCRLEKQVTIISSKEQFFLFKRRP